MHSTVPATPFSAIVMAADRNPEDPVARAAGVTCKALAPVSGTPMVLRVLQALEESLEVGPRLLCGPPRPLLEQAVQLKSGVDAGDYGWMASRESPSASAAAAMEQIQESQPVLLTTAVSSVTMTVTTRSVVSGSADGLSKRISSIAVS